MRLLIFLLLILSAVSCSNSDLQTREEYELTMKNKMQEIENLIAAGSCDENSDCDSLPVGKKACGGPHAYVIFSTNIDVQKLQQLVNEYTSLELEYNQKFEIVSDCAIVNPPQTIGCIDSKCGIVMN